MKSHLSNKITLLLLVFCSVFASPKLFSQGDLCSGATAVPLNTSCITSAYNINKNWNDEIANTTCNASGGQIDGWMQFTTGATTASISITATTNKDLVLAVYKGACGALTQAACSDAGGSGITETITNMSVTPNTTYFIRLIRTNSSNKTMTGTICITEPNTPPANDDCAGAILTACAGTYTGSTALSTVGTDPAGTCGTTAGTPGVWYKFVGNGNTITASLCGSGYDTKIQVYSGSCAGLVCVTGNDDFCGTSSQVSWTSVNLTNYFIFVGGFGSATGTYSLTMTCAVPSLPNCSVKTAPANSSTLTCASTNFAWNAPIGGGIPTSYLLFFGTDAAATNINNGTDIGNVLTYAPPALLNNTTYYWKIVPTNAVGNAVGCTTFSFVTGGTTPINDNCAGALVLTSGVTINDDNSCATSEATAIGSCWNAGSVNSLWYSMVVPATGSLSVLTGSLTLIDTQIAIYSGGCGALVEVACNNDAQGSGCGAVVTSNSQLNLTGLAAGTYMIRVDGRSSTIGTYNILASTTGVVGTAVAIAGSDCPLPLTYCSFPVSIPDPGYFNTGNICDFGGSGSCIAIGEQNALWVRFTALTAGQLAFNIIPNDYTGCDLESDYDWVLYRTTGAGSTTCSNIKTTNGGGSLACNWSAQGVTGMSSTFNAPGGNVGNQPTNTSSGFTLVPAPGVGCYNSGYEPSITAAIGDVFTLVIQNYAASNIGFNLTVPVALGIATLGNAVPTTLMWTSGAATTTFTNPVNWSNCVVPSCTPPIDAIILSGPANQPIVAINTSIKSMLINPSATLTINSGVVLDVCGDFVNNGVLRCLAGSTVNFSGTSNQLISGNLTGINKFSNLTVNKTAGIVTLGNNIEVGQDFTTANITSIVNTSGTDFIVGRDFVNSNGATTFTGITSTSSFIFNGTVAQIYNPNKNSAAPTLTLCNVTMSNTSTGVTLSATNTPSLVLNTTGILTLTSGKIITSGVQEVIVTNTGNTAVSSGNTTSYVEGNLRRFLAAGATGPFDFPVGHATPGYERANLVFTSAAAAGAINLLARFDPWGGTWPLPSVPNWSECGTIYNLPYLNNGYWSIDASAVSTGLYNLTLYNRGYTNATGGAYSIAKSPSVGPAWALNGNCVGSPVTAVIRNGMSGFSKMSTTQGATPLPVELISFYAFSEGIDNSIIWKSAVETRFKQYELESSEDGINFTKIATMAPLGNTSTYNNYNYLDLNYYRPITYYRLKMIDLDYTYKYSQIIAVEYGNSKTKNLIVYPNPASNELFVKLDVQGEKEANVEIRDILGRIILQQKIDMSQGVDNTYINTTNFATGTYIVNITCGNSFSENIKITINKD